MPLRVIRLPPRHGLESPCHLARAFQPVGLGRAVRSARRPPSVVRPLPSDFCAFCASSRPILRHPPSVIPPSDSSASCAFSRLKCVVLMPPLPDLVLQETIRGLKRPEIPSYFAPFALLRGHPSSVRLRRLSLISRFQLFDPSSILLLSLCTSSVGSVTQSSFRLLRLLRVFAANPSSFVRHTPSALRSLRSLL